MSSSWDLIFCTPVMHSWTWGITYCDSKRKNYCYVISRQIPDHFVLRWPVTMWYCHHAREWWWLDWRAFCDTKRFDKPEPRDSWRTPHSLDLRLRPIGVTHQSPERDLSRPDTDRRISPGTVWTSCIGDHTPCSEDCVTVTGCECSCQAKHKWWRNPRVGRPNHIVQRRFCSEGQWLLVSHCTDAGEACLIQQPQGGSWRMCFWHHTGFACTSQVVLHPVCEVLLLAGSATP